METVTDLAGKLEREEKGFDVELQSIGEQIAAIQGDARFSDEHKSERIAGIKAAGEAQLQARAKTIWDTAQALERGAAIERQSYEMQYEQTFDAARLSFLSQEYAARLSAASSLDDVLRIKQEVASSGDAHKVRASRIAMIAAARGFVSSSDQAVRTRANSFLRELMRESDTTPEIEAARDREKGAAFKLRMLEGRLSRIGAQLKPNIGWGAGLFDEAMGKPKSGGVVWGDKSKPMHFE